MKRFPLYILTVVSLLIMGCGGDSRISISDYKIDVYTPECASGFDIRGAEHAQSLLLTVRNPWQGGRNVQQQTFLAYDQAKAPKGFSGQVVRMPVRRAVCMSSSHVAMFEALGEAKRIVGVSGIDYISNQYINEHKFCGEVRDIGYDTNLDFELIVSLRPDVVLLYGVSGESPTITGKLTELNIPYIYVGDYVEESPLGKAEWLVAIAALCDNTKRGEACFAQIRDRYNTLKDSVAHAEVKPKVMLNTPYSDTWFMPSSQSYMVRLIQDAGGEYIYTGNHSNTSLPIDIEEAFLLARGADLWLNVGMVNSLAELKAQVPKFVDIPVVREGRIYNNNRRTTPAGGSDFWESGVVQPDKILEDMIHIFRNEESDLYYYHRLQ